ncbi:MAG: cell division protein FtsA [Spirochaetota bacterium]
MAKNDSICALDVGTSSVKALISEMHDGEVTVLGVGRAVSNGVRKGTVVNIDAAAAAIASAVEKAEIMAGGDVSRVVTSLGGDHLSGINSKGVIGVTARNREITPFEVERVLESARSIRLPSDCEIIHLFPQEYAVDDHDEVRNPVGMTGARLEAEAHIITGMITNSDNLMRAIRKAGIEVDDVIASPYAASYAVLTPDERELGVALIDIGAATTSVMFFIEGAVTHTAVLPIGAQHVTSDISMGLRISHTAAEEVKMSYGFAMSEMVSDTEAIEVPSTGDRPPRTIPKKTLSQIIEPRMEEIFRLVLKEIEKVQCKEVLSAGAVLTGGGAMLGGATDVAEAVFGTMPARVGYPTGFSGMLDIGRDATCAVAVGLTLMKSSEQNPAPGIRKVRERKEGNTGGKLSGWFKEFFS